MSKITARRSFGATLAFCVIASLCTTAVAQSGSTTFTSVFPNETSFVTKGTNPFWILTPGFHEVLEGQKSGNVSKVDITVTNSTHTTADGFPTRVVRDWIM